MKKKIVSGIVGVSLMLTPVSSVFASGYPVFDVSGWLNGIDQLYQEYDMVKNTITQIENQYKSIQHSIEVAKSIDWDNINFDGDFDIRNDIKNANKRVNKLLTQARNIKTTLTTPSINCGNVKYSIADLCGCTSSDTWESRKNLLTAVSDYKYYMTNTMKEAVSSVVDGLDEKQRKAIWVKYGISPSNYVFIQQSQTSVMASAQKVMAKATEQAEEMVAEEKLAKANAIIAAALDNTDSDGNPTAAGMQEAQLHLSEEILQQLVELGFNMNEVGQMTAAQLIAKDAQEQAEKDEAARVAEIESNSNSQLSSRFIKK
ncbi:MAG: hypothetical protein K6C98_02615 [Treponema sp.]|nr:hypothetical protein [Treponema sp.]